MLIVILVALGVAGSYAWMLYEMKNAPTYYEGCCKSCHRYFFGTDKEFCDQGCREHYEDWSIQYEEEQRQNINQF